MKIKHGGRMVNGFPDFLSKELANTWDKYVIIVFFMHMHCFNETDQSLL